MIELVPPLSAVRSSTVKVALEFVVIVLVPLSVALISCLMVSFALLSAMLLALPFALFWFDAPRVSTIASALLVRVMPLVPPALAINQAPRLEPSKIIRFSPSLSFPITPAVIFAPCSSSKIFFPEVVSTTPASRFPPCRMMELTPSA